MLNMNTNQRLLLDEQKHDIIFQCNYCGKHQTISLILQSDRSKGVCILTKI